MIADANMAETDSDLAFVDVAANALAMIILALLFVVILSTQPPHIGEPDDAAVDTSLTFPPRLDPTFGPFNEYYIIVPEGLVPLDLNAPAQALFQGKTSHGSALAKTTMFVPRIGRRDYDEFNAIITPVYKALPEHAEALNEALVSEVLSELDQGFKQRREVATFFVTADAIDVFAPLYWGLRDQGLPLRWRLVERGKPLPPLSRKPENFERAARRW